MSFLVEFKWLTILWGSVIVVILVVTTIAGHLLPSKFVWPRRHWHGFSFWSVIATFRTRHCLVLFIPVNMKFAHFYIFESLYVWRYSLIASYFWIKYYLLYTFSSDMIITVTSFASQAGILPVFVAWLTLQAFWFDNLECRQFSLLLRNPIYIKPLRCGYLHLTQYLTRSLMLKLIVLTQMVVTKAANKYASTMVPNTSFAFYTYGSLKILLE